MHPEAESQKKFPWSTVVLPSKKFIKVKIVCGDFCQSIPVEEIAQERIFKTSKKTYPRVQLPYTVVLKQQNIVKIAKVPGLG